MNRFERADIALEYEGWVSGQVAKYVDPAFHGDVDAAYSLSFFSENNERGILAVAMWQAKVKREAFRAYFSSVWDHDHQWVIDAAQTRRRLAAMFRYAKFSIPDELPDVVRVWRGTSKLSMDDARQGYSWTTDRDTACWFAMRFADNNGSPLVLAADVAKTDIVLFCDDRKEREAVLMKPPVCFIDGDVADWTQCQVRQIEARKQDHVNVVAG